MKATSLKNSPVVRVITSELRQSLPLVLLVALTTILQTLTGLISPYLIKILFDAAIPQRDMTLIAWLLAGMVGAPLVAVAISGLREWLSAALGSRVSGALMSDAFDYLIRARITYIERVKTGEIVYRLTRECGRIGQLYLAQEVLPLMDNSILFIGALAVMFTMDWRLSLFLLLSLPLSYLITRCLARPAKTVDQGLMDVLEEGHVYLQEVLGGLRTVRAFNGQPYESRHWHDWNKRRLAAQSRSSFYHLGAFLNLGSNLVNHIFVGFVMGYGAMRIIAGDLTVGALISFVAYVPQVYGAFAALLRTQVGTQQIEPSVRALEELYHLPLEPALPSVPQAISAGALAFENVSFRYERGFAVEHLTFAVQPGEFVALVGPSGGGKSTIVDLLMGFHQPDFGTVAVDGRSTRDLSLNDLRQAIGYVPQDVLLWNTSIRENLVYPDQAYTDADLERATAAAEILEFIRGLPQGFDTLVGERGATLSGGERQRLALARAILRQPKIILLDEATSSLDALTELRVRQALDNVRVGRTTLVVAHRLTTVLHADRILVVEGGRIVEAGTPDALLAAGGRFAALYEASLPSHAGGNANA